MWFVFKNLPWQIILAGVLSYIGSVLFLLIYTRIHLGRITNLFRTGIALDSQVIYSDGKGIVEVTFNFQGKQQYSSIRLTKEAARQFQKGDTVMLLVDPHDPYRSIPRDLFIEHNDHTHRMIGR